jgi:shikimate dehydrogenase
MSEPRAGDGRTALGLGLIGHGIGRSLSPRLHEILGELTDRPVDYPVLDHDEHFTPQLDALLSECVAEGRAGVNVTHPFKESVVALIDADPLVAMLGACNTVCFHNGQRVGHNTDCTGLEAALRPILGPQGPGTVSLIGSGGFGRAAAFAVARLGATSLRIFDPVRERAEALAQRVGERTATHATVADAVGDACTGADGVVNCSPIGMHHHPGNPVPEVHLASVRWVFDAVYIPMQTEFLRAGSRVGALAISGSELFFWQAIHAFEHFTAEPLAEPTIAAARERIWPEVERRAKVGE